MASIVDPPPDSKTPPPNYLHCPDCGTPSNEHWNRCSYYIAKQSTAQPPADKSWFRAKLRAILARRLNEAPRQSCDYCQAQPDDWCEYDCGSPFPVVHPENREATS